MNNDSLHQSADPVTHSIAYTFGKQDATAGASCYPEMYFTREDDIRDYRSGYASVAGPRRATVRPTAKE